MGIRGGKRSFYHVCAENCQHGGCIPRHMLPAHLISHGTTPSCCFLHHSVSLIAHVTPICSLGLVCVVPVSTLGKQCNSPAPGDWCVSEFKFKNWGLHNLCGGPWGWVQRKGGCLTQYFLFGILNGFGLRQAMPQGPRSRDSLFFFFPLSLSPRV